MGNESLQKAVKKQENAETHSQVEEQTGRGHQSPASHHFHRGQTSTAQGRVGARRHLVVSHSSVDQHS